MQTITVWNMTASALLYITHETAICYNLLIHNFYRRWKKLDRSLIDKHLNMLCFYKNTRRSNLVWDTTF